MELKQQNILFFTRTMCLGGTENVVLQLCEIFKPLVNKIIVCSCGGVNVKKLKAMGIKHYEIPDIEQKSPMVIFKTINTLKQIVREENITIIHTHHRMAAFYAQLIKKKEMKLVANAHNTFYDKKALTKFAYRNTSVIAVGQQVKKNLCEFFTLREDHVTVIHNTVNPFDSEVVKDGLVEKLHKEGYFVICNVGRLSEQKGMSYFIKAIPSVISVNPNVRFLIAGQGEEEEELKNLAKKINVEEYLYFLGYRSDIQNLLSQVDLIVLSSLWEGLPLTPIEAFSVRKTVIGTAVDGTVEIIEDGKSGILIKPKDPEAIANNIIRLISDRRYLEELENNAFIRYNEEFSFENLKSAYLIFYDSL